MKVYLLKRKRDGGLLGVYKYADVAISRGERQGIRGAISEVFDGGKAEKEYVVEVRELIE